jgi:hypothetical protein
MKLLRAVAFAARLAIGLVPARCWLQTPRRRQCASQADRHHLAAQVVDLKVSPDGKYFAGTGVTDEADDPAHPGPAHHDRRAGKVYEVRSASASSAGTTRTTC